MSPACPRDPSLGDSLKSEAEKDKKKNKTKDAPARANERGGERRLPL